MNPHLIGAGGIGMSGLRTLLEKSLIPFTASDDANPSPGFIPETQIPEACDCIVISSAIKPDHPQYRWAAQNGIPIFHRAKYTKLIIDRVGGKLISISGSHGKTTCSAILAWVLQKSTHSTSFLIGGHFAGTTICADLTPNSEYFVLESDESDGSMNVFGADLALLTNISEEHISHYGTFSNLVSEMNRFIDSATECICHESCADLIQRRDGVIFYSDSGISNIEQTETGSSFSATGPWGTWSDIHIKLFGRHMLQNTIGCITLLHNLGIDKEAIINGLCTFPGVKKRMEIFDAGNDRRIIQDYAHHPKEVAEVISSILQIYPTRCVHIIWEPHKFSRISYGDNYRSFIQSLRSTNGSVLLLPVWSAGEEYDPRFSQKEISKDIPRSVIVNSSEDILAWCETNFRDQDILLAMGAGGIYSTVYRLIASLNTSNS